MISKLLRILKKSLVVLLLIAPIAGFAVTGEETDGISNNQNTASKSSSGADGLQLQVVPVDASIPCDSVILRGTQLYRGTAFVVPRMTISMNQNREPLFEVLPDPLSNGFIFRFGLFFPRTDMDAKFGDRLANPELFTGSCDFAAVKADLNKTLPDDEKIQRVTRVPIKSMEISLGGFAKKASVGSWRTSMLHYQGTDLIVEFRFSNRKQLDAFLTRLTGKIGINIQADLKFNSRGGAGSLKATVDLKEIAAKLESALKGTFQIATVDLGTKIEQACSEAKIRIQSEAGVPQEMVEKITEQIMSMIKEDLTTAPANVAGETNGSENSNSENGSGAKYEVKAIIAYLKKQRNIEFDYSQLGENQEVVYRTSAIIKASIGDPAVRDLTLRSVPHQSSYVHPNNLEPNDEIALTPLEDWLEPLAYNEKTTYFSTDELVEKNLGKYFDFLKDPDKSIKDSFMPGIGWVAMASFRKYGFSPWVTNYVWGKTEKVAYVSGISQAITHARDLNDLTSWPLLFQFSRLSGKWYTLPDLLKFPNDNPYLETKFDEFSGKVIFRAKSALGSLSIRIAETTPKLYPSQIASYYFQEPRRGPIAEHAGTIRKGERKKELPAERRAVQIRLQNQTPKSTDLPVVEKPTVESSEGLINDPPAMQID